MLLFTADMITAFCAHANKYAWTNIFEKQSYAQPDGWCLEVMPPEMLHFIALLIYMGIVQLPQLHLYSICKMLSRLPYQAQRIKMGKKSSAWRCSVNLGRKRFVSSVKSDEHYSYS